MDASRPESSESFFSIDTDTALVERDPTRFWSTVTTPQEWHDDIGRDRTDRFIQLNDILESSLGNIKYFGIGESKVTLYYPVRTF